MPRLLIRALEGSYLCPLSGSVLPDTSVKYFSSNCNNKNQQTIIECLLNSRYGTKFNENNNTLSAIVMTENKNYQRVQYVPGSLLSAFLDLDRFMLLKIIYPLSDYLIFSSRVKVQVQSSKIENDL